MQLLNPRNLLILGHQFALNQISTFHGQINRILSTLQTEYEAPAVAG